MSTHISKPSAAAMKPVTTKLSLVEFNQLVEQAEAESTTVSAVIRSAIQQRTETVDLHMALDNLRATQERFMLAMMGEVHNIKKDELQTIRHNIRRKLLDQDHEQ